MKTIIDTTTKVSIHLLPDDDTRSLSDLQVDVHATIIENVSVPDEYYGYKYKYTGGAWELDEAFLAAQYASEN